MSKEKKSILEEAATDLQQIVEAAKKVAKDNLVKELPQKFDMLLNEELEKVSSKESVNESVKDKYKKEPVKGKKTDDKKESINEELDMSECSLGEVESAFDQASDTEQFSIKPDGETPNEVTVDTIAQAIDSIGELNTEKEMVEASESDPYTKFKELAEQMAQMVKEMDDKKMHEDYGAEFNQQMGGLYGESYKTSLGEEKCNELYEMFVANKKTNMNESDTKPFVEKGKTLTEDEDQPFDDKASSSSEQGANIAEQKKNGGEQTKGRENGGPTKEMIDEKEEGVEIEIEDDKVEVEVDGSENKDDVDEAMGMAHSSSKQAAGDHLPGKEFAKHRHKRVGSVNNPKNSANETYEKRMKSLIEDNKKLTKENNVAKKSFGKAEQLVESYKSHLEKYRTQLREMAVFNTNLANVNNLLVNEEFALTSKDKISIINKFKSINSINESDKVYGQVIDFMKKGVKTITEDVEKKVITSVGESNKGKIDEAIERTAYSDNEHLKKIKSMMFYDNKKN